MTPVGAGRLAEQLRVGVLGLLALLAVVLAGGQPGAGAPVVLALLVAATAVALAPVAALLPLLVARGAAGPGSRGPARRTGPPLPRVSEPGAAGSPRPRAPGGTAAR